MTKSSLGRNVRQEKARPPFHSQEKPELINQSITRKKRRALFVVVGKTGSLNFRRQRFQSELTAERR
jgi:hypothetical protein